MWGRAGLIWDDGQVRTPHDFQLPALAVELGERFTAAGYELALVGGPVRDLFLGRAAPDLDFTTNADPDQILDVVWGWAETTWDVGREFGTIAMRKHGEDLEVTTYRADVYDSESRKPHVRFGSRLEDDLARRDFTVNAMALRLPDAQLVDPHGGQADVEAGVLRTPSGPAISFSDDPLRMMRGARFMSQLGFELAEPEIQAMKEMAQRLEIVSAERVRDELNKLMLGPDPVAGLEIMVATGLAEYVLPELSALRMATDANHRHKDVYQHSLTVLRQAIDHEGASADDPVPGPDLVLRLAALLHDIGKPATRRFENGAVSFRHHEVVGAKLVRKRLRALRYDNDTIKAVVRLVELHMRFYGYADAGWSDSAVRRYVNDAGEVLSRLHLLTRSDVTTQNRRKAERLEHAYDDLEDRIDQLAEQEALDAIRPDLDGQQIMAILGIKPGPVVGQAYRFLLDRRLDRGPVDAEQAREELLAWWAEQAH